MFDFDAFLKELKIGIRDIAREEAKGFVRAARKDGKEFVDALKEDLELWTKQLADGELSVEDFEFLVRGKKDLAKMAGLTQAGLAAVRIDRIRMAMIDLVITAADKMA